MTEFIVKKQPEPELKGYNIPVVERFDFYVTETVKDISDKDVQILKLVGSYSMNDLLKQKESLENSLNDVIAKINSIAK